MEIKLFGKSLFEVKKTNKAEIWLESSQEKAKESKYLPDFHQRRGIWETETELSNYVAMPDSNGNAVMVPVKKKAKAQTVKLTPKGVHELKLLHDTTFQLKTDPKYIDEQLVSFKEKLSLIKAEEYDMRNGTDEIASIVMRLENRKKYGEVQELFEEFPYTTTSKINELVKSHEHLKLGQVAQFIADMPKEAIDAMKRYNTATDKVCGKQAVFYIIADKKDFKKSDSRRDPILLAQSPFGHFWQILGAWDEEMMFLEEL